MSKTVPYDIDNTDGIGRSRYRDFVEHMLDKQYGVDVDAQKMLMDDDLRQKVQKKGTLQLDNGLRFIKCTRNSNDYCCIFQVNDEWVCSGRCKQKKGFWKAMMMTDDWHWRNPPSQCPYRLCNKQGFDRDREKKFIFNTLVREAGYERKSYEKNY